jgi:hypothetical protein
MRTIRLGDGYVALVDDEDADRALSVRWTVKEPRQPGGSPYAVFVRHTKAGVVSLSLHRFIAGANAGELVDHRNGEGLDNRRSNLRRCTSRENARNRTRYVRRKRLSGGFLGVYYNKRARLWVASIHAGETDANGEAKKISLKLYSTPEEAARVYDSAAAYYFGEFASLNFPEEEPEHFDLHALRGTSGLSAGEKSAISRANMKRNRKVGDEHPRAKLKDADVVVIRQSGLPARALAERFGITAARVHDIRNGRGFRHVLAAKVAPPKGKLSPDQVREIRSLVEQGHSYQRVAREHNVATATVFRIVHRVYKSYQEAS